MPLLRVAIPAEGVEAGDSLQLTYLGDSQTPHQLTDADISNGFVDVQLTLSLQDADGNLNDVPVKWIDWTTQSGTMVSGAFNTETGVVNASLTSTSSYAGVQLSGGTNYFNPTSPYISDGVAAPTSSDIIRFNPAGWRTLSFDSEVRNLYFAFVSMNGNGYRFDRDFDILSQTDNPDSPEDEGGGNGYWGSGWAEKVEVIIDGQTYWELRAVNGEPHGVIQFKGAFSDLTWENPVSENWHGFTIGIKSATEALQNVSGEFLDGNDGSVISTTPTTLISYDPTRSSTSDPLDTTISSARIDEANLGLQVSGSLTQFDVDTSNILSAEVDSVVISGVTSGLLLTNADALALFNVVSTDMASTQVSSLQWTFDSATEAFDYLAPGEELTFTYSVSTHDGEGFVTSDGTQSSDNSTVTVTIVGTNDGPEITPGVVTGALTEGSGVYSHAGFVDYSDIDLSDRHSATIITNHPDAISWSGGSLTEDQVSSLLAGWHVSPDVGNDNNGRFNWTYTTNYELLDFLREGETITLKGYLEVLDSHEGADRELLTLVITGTNDTPVITNGDDITSLIESNISIADSGVMDVIDLDLNDSVATSVTSVAITGGSFNSSDIPIPNAQLQSLLTLTSDEALSALSADEGVQSSFTWTFDSDTSFDFLAAGETLELTYTIQAQDDSPEISGQQSDLTTSTVTVIVTGSNDSPDIQIVDVSGSVAEDYDLHSSGQVIIIRKLYPSMGCMKLAIFLH